MEGRLVVSFRAVSGAGRPFVERARSLLARLEPLGAVHVGWDVARLTFAFDPDKLAEILALLVTPDGDTIGDEPPWAVGMAQGDLRVIQEEGSPILASGLLWWGPPFVAASALATLARPGEVLCAQTVPALRNGELVTSGMRIARDGSLRVRGARIDKRQPWKHGARQNLSRLVEPKLVTSHLPPLTLAPGGVVVLRADPGTGGTRMLQELAAQSPKALFVSPVGSGFEPLGALRRAFARSADAAVNPLVMELGAPFDSLLAGKGVPLELAAKLIAALLWPKVSGTSSALIIDDVKSVDAATLEACVRAVRSNPSFGLVVRLERESSLPSLLAQLPVVAERELAALSREGAEEIAVGVTGGVLDATGRSRWARLGAGNPLTIVEAITAAIASGDLVFTANQASPRTRSAGRGTPVTAAKWIRRRANAEPTPARIVLSLLAVIGGEANAGFMERVLERAGIRIDLRETLLHLERTRWIVQTQAPSSKSDAWYAFPTRTHRKALFTTLEDEARRGLHLTIWRVTEEGEGIFGRVEGAWHAAQAGETKRAASIFLDGAKVATTAHLDASAKQLLALAQRVDPATDIPSVTLPSGEPAAQIPSVSFPPPPASLRPEIRSGAQRVAAMSLAPLMPGGLGRPPVVPPGLASAMAANVSDLETTSFPADEPDSLIERALIVRRADAPDAPPSPIESEPPEMPSLEGWNLDAELPAAEAPPPSETAASRPPESKRAVASRPPGFGSRPPGFGSRPPGFGSRPPGFGSRPPGFGSRPPGFGSRPPLGSVPPSGPGSQIAYRLGQMAKDALRSPDDAALERWVNGDAPATESPVFTERLRAMAHIEEGDIGDALRVLRKTQAALAPTDHRRRCQTSLALGVALSVAGQPDEALLEALDALARARQDDDERGAKACLAFLAKLYQSFGHEAEATRLRSVSV